MGTRSPFPGWTEINRRRQKLIVKKYMEGLTKEEEKRLEMFQTIAGAVCDYYAPDHLRIPEIEKGGLK